MPMSDGRIGRWSAVLREALAVLAAILAAFALDAWWDGRVEEREMRDALDAVRVELEDNAGAIRGALAYNSAQAELVADALDLTTTEVGEMTDEDMGRFSNLPNFQVVTLRLGATAAFIEGGHLRALDDRELRGVLAGLSEIQSEIDEEGSVVDGLSSQLTSTLLRAAGMDWMRTPQDMASPSGTRAILEAVATDDEVRRLLYGRTFLLNLVYGLELTNVSQQLDSVGVLIDAELGG